MTLEQSNNEKPANGSILSNATSKAIEKVFVYIMYTAIVGSAVFFYTKLHSIEKNIAQHHGQDWQELSNIVQISQIQGEVSNVRESLLNGISENENEIASADLQIKQLKNWARHNDMIMLDENRSIYSANALYDDFGGSEALCKVNIAHLNGGEFKIGDLVSITNEDSRQKDTINCTIDSTINDRDEGSVLYSLNAYAAQRLSFTKEVGRISISTNLVDIPEYRRWRAINEFGL